MKIMEVLKNKMGGQYDAELCRVNELLNTDRELCVALMKHAIVVSGE